MIKINYVDQSITALTAIESEDDLLCRVGHIAGECYNSSRDRDACIKRALNCIKRGHHSPWEHANITLSCVMDRGTSHAVVRHRHCAFQQSSTIYQKYDDALNIVRLPTVDPFTHKGCLIDNEEVLSDDYYTHCGHVYEQLLAAGSPPHRARDVLPNSLATTLIITTNIREYMYIIQRRCGPGDAIRMHVFATQLRDFFKEHYPRITEAFEEWYMQHPL